MNNKNFLLYLAVYFLGLVISIFVIKGNFSLQASAVVVFFLIFIPTLLKPNIGLIIIIISMLLSPESTVGSTTARAVIVRAEDVILLVIMLAWFIRTSFTKDILAVFKTRMSVPFFLYILACVISSLLAALFGELDIALSFFTILKYFEYFMLFLMTVDILKDMKQVRTFILVFFLAALVVSIFANVYVNKELSAGSEFIRAISPVERRGAGEPGTLGGYLILMMAIAAGLLLHTRSTVVRIFLICLELFMFRAFLYTLSRGSYLAFIPAILALIYFTKRYKLALIYGACVFTLLFAFFAPRMVMDRIFNTVTTQNVISGSQVVWEDSPRERLDSWKKVLFERFPQKPIFGYGVAKFFIDGQLFLTLCEVGLLGLILFCWVLARLFRMAKAALDTEEVQKDDFSLGLCVGFLAGFIGLLFTAIGTNTFLLIKIMEPFWFMAAIILSLPVLLKSEETALAEQS